MDLGLPLPAQHPARDDWGFYHRVLLSGLVQAHILCSLDSRITGSGQQREAVALQGLPPGSSGLV